MLQHLGVPVALSGYAIGLSVGISLGIGMGWSEKFDWFARPIFDIIRPVPGIAWIPVMITLFGIGLLSKAMVIFLSSFTASLVSTYSGIKQTKAVHLWVGRTFGASNRQLLFKIAIPSALPMLLTGMRVALASSWGALVARKCYFNKRFGIHDSTSKGSFTSRCHYCRDDYHWSGWSPYHISVNTSRTLFTERRSVVMMQNKHEDSITTHSANNKDTVDFNEDKKQSSQIKTKGRDRRKLLFQILGNHFNFILSFGNFPLRSWSRGLARSF